MTALIDLYADNTLLMIDMLSDPLFPLAFPAHEDACPCCGDVGYTAVRNGDDDCPCQECARADEEEVVF